MDNIKLRKKIAESETVEAGNDDPDFRRRIGTFVISNQLLLDHPDLVQQTLARVIVVRAEQRYDIDGIEYIAICKDFPVLPSGTIPRRYTPIWRTDDDGIPVFEAWH